MSRTKHGSNRRDTVISDLTRNVEKIWNDADCCPFTFKHIVKVFNKEIWETYKHLQREKCLPGVEGLGKRSHKKDPAKAKKYDEPQRKSSRFDKEKCNQPQRKSSRLDRELPSTSSGIQTQICNTEDKDDEKEETVDSPIPVVSVQTRYAKGKSTTIRDIWELEGRKLFDVRNEKRVKKSSKEGFCFDLSFYEDQKEQRKLRMVLTKVTKEFIEEDLRRKKKETIPERNRLSALGDSQTATEEDDTDDFHENVIEVDEDQDVTDIDTCNSSFSDGLNSSVCTRSKAGSHF